ncbi:MAG: hypothetical protein AAF800_11210 [Planctomycetota bacterium]
MRHQRVPKKESAKLQIYADADLIDEFTEFYKKLGMSQREAGSRLFAWFNKQSPLIRRHIFEPLPDDVAPDIARIILERMAEQDRLRSNSDAAGGSGKPDEAPKDGQQTNLSVYGED